MNTARRLLDHFLAEGGDWYLRSDGRVVLKGPRVLIDAVMPQVNQIGRDKLAAEVRIEDLASTARLRALLTNHAASRSPRRAP